MASDIDELVAEHLASWRQYGAAQQRCSRVINAQHARITQLEAQLMRARAACIVQATALAFAAEDRAGCVVAMPALPAGPAARDHLDAQALEDSLVAADLVICQAGCLTHGDYWRVQDHCRRTGKACVVVERPDAVRIVRLQRETNARSPAAPTGAARGQAAA